VSEFLFFDYFRKIMYNSDLPNRAELPSSKKLLLSTLIAIVVAAILLVTIVLPSEYGIDPTRIGRVLGLTQMGEIKTRLAEEAKQDREKETASKTSEQTVPTQPKPAESAKPAENKGNAKNDTMTVTLKPGEGVEIKLEMTKGAKAVYDWKTSGGVLNYDLHGDGANKAFISYKKGTGVENDSGEFAADFDGSHGWFWRNRTDGDVTVTLNTKGEYASIKRVV
jgi:hypothetical protein